MTWYKEAVFYYIYPLGLTDAPKQNSYNEPVHRLDMLFSWISHIKEIGCNAIYIGPLFESVGHGYETTDYKKVDSRLGTNDDLTRFVSECHKQGIRVILDGVFNHTGRDFFAFQDIKRNRENSRYKNWYCDVIRFWVNAFDIDGIRLDAADVLDFHYMKVLRKTANEIKSDFWLMGEVIHGNYSRWVNNETLHSVTNYVLHKALYSAYNDHNYFEIAHAIKYINDMVGNGSQLYTFVDNHDVERIYTKLKNKSHFVPVHVMLYTLPGIPSIYYGSEFGIQGRKEQYSDESLRPALNYKDYKDAIKTNACTKLIAALGRIRQNIPALCHGEYKELELQTTYFVYERTFGGKSVIITVNNADNDVNIKFTCENSTEYVGALTGEQVSAKDGHIQVRVSANYGEIWIPAELYKKSLTPVKMVEIKKSSKSVKVVEKKLQAEKRQEEKKAEKAVIDLKKPYEEMSSEFKEKL
ncbi:MAG: alpha-amylase family glycosyl hydrolase [Schaedlerella sp.]|nr:alpha-amylase family glycosyl hydrolase [Schaedlerella sp.]